MNDKERLRLVSMVAAYVGVPYGQISVMSIRPANSSRVQIQMPSDAAKRLIKGFESRDPLLQAFLDDIGLINVERGPSDHGGSRMRQHSDTSEKGLESLIVRSLIEQAGYAAGDPRDFDRDHAVDLAKLLAFLIATQPKTVEALGIGG